jgi:hypothetical protein
MKVTMEFELPEQESEFNRAVNGAKMALMLHDLFEELRSRYKHKEYLSDEARQECLQIREKINDLVYEHGISFLYEND